MNVLPSGPTNAKIIIVGEAPGKDEEEKGTCFVGASGMELTRMLDDAGIMRSACFLTNVIRVRPPNNDLGAFIAFKKKDVTKAYVPLRDKMVLPIVREGYELLKAEIEAIKPNLIIAVGNAAMWALTGRWGITNWRGSELWTDQIRFEDGTAPTVLPTYHPAAILRQWELRKVALADLRKAKRLSVNRVQNHANYQFVIRPNFHTVMQTLESLTRALEVQPYLSVDIETRAGHIACLGIAWSKTQAICIPLMCTERDTGYWMEEEEVAIVAALQDLLLHPLARIIGQNFWYDAQYIYRHLGFLPITEFDTSIGQHSLFCNLPKKLYFLASLYCEQYVYWKDDGKTWDKSTGEEQLWAYNCEDCVRTYEVAETERRLTAEMGLESVQSFQQSLAAPVIETMVRGVRIDKERRKAFKTELSAGIDERQAWLKSILGHEINPRSPTQLYTLFCDDLHLKPVMKRRDEGKWTPSFDEEALQTLAHREPILRPIVDTIGEIRTLGVFQSTFVDAPLDTDGRMRCEYKIPGTITYRFASGENAFGSGTNLQNVPHGDEATTSAFALPNVRRLFIPDDGYEFFDIDLDSADLQIVVAESNCLAMREMLDAGLKPYVEIAKEYYHDPAINKRHPKYGSFKSLCHGTNYLGEASGVAPRVGLLVHEVERIQRWYFGKFPEIKSWQESVIARINKDRRVENVWGYRRHVFERIDKALYREIVAWIPQSTIAILINKIYRRLYDNCPAIQVLLQVHDSLAGQYPAAERLYWLNQIIEQSKIEIPYSTPLVINIGIKTSQTSWGDCA